MLWGQTRGEPEFFLHAFRFSTSLSFKNANASRMYIFYVPKISYEEVCQLSSQAREDLVRTGHERRFYCVLPRFDSVKLMKSGRGTG